MFSGRGFIYKSWPYERNTKKNHRIRNKWTQPEQKKIDKFCQFRTYIMF